MMALNMPMAALVENAEDRFVALQLASQGGRDASLPAADVHVFQLRDVLDAMFGFAGFQPGREVVEEERVIERLTPDGRIFHAGFGERAVEVQHADQARPGAGPVRGREDRAAMSDQAGEDVVAVLPDRLGHDERRLGVEPGEDVLSLRAARR